jgi:hypothetical protein
LNSFSESAAATASIRTDGGSGDGFLYERCAVVAQNLLGWPFIVTVTDASGETLFEHQADRLENAKRFVDALTALRKTAVER